MSTTTTTTTETRAISLLGQGLGPEVVAAAIGVSTGRISQLLSDPAFSAQVAELRYENLAKHNTRDSAYDSMEDTLLEKLKDCLPFMMRPMEILKSIQVINQAKRRGASAPESIISQQTVVQLLMPTQILQQFTTNINNQVIKTGDQDLVTVQSASMNSLLDKLKLTRSQGVTNVSLPNETRNASSSASA
jgi:type I site-specific restriction endonuclease